jgi:hypothetical protein
MGGFLKFRVWLTVATGKSWEEPEIRICRALSDSFRFARGSGMGRYLIRDDLQPPIAAFYYFFFLIFFFFFFFFPLSPC